VVGGGDDVIWQLQGVLGDERNSSINDEKIGRAEFTVSGG
jgi:hypothetical protein